MKLALIASLLLFLIHPVSALIPVDNIVDNQSYVTEPNTNSSFVPENHEIFEPEETVLPIPIPTTQSTSSSSSGSSGGGSGGGGVTSTENFSNILKYEQHERTLIAGQLVSFKFNLSVYEILLIGKENEYDVSVRVELLKDKPNKATKPQGEVIQYFNVITSSKRLKEAIIHFKSNITESKLKLMKWDNSSWIETNSDYYPYIPGNSEARQIDDKDYVHYQAKTDSLSSFAIVKDTSMIQATSPSQPLMNNESVLTPTPIITNSPKPSPDFGVGLVLMAFIIAIFKKGRYS